MPTWQIYVLTPARIDAIAWGALLAINVRSPAYRAQEVERQARRVLWLAGLCLGLMFPFGWLENDRTPFIWAGYSLVAVFFTQVLALAIHAPERSS